MYPAKFGDSFLLNLKDENEKSFNILIDGGFKSTFRDYLKKDLSTLNSQNQVLDLLIVTHIDIDHINGCIALLEDNNSSENPNLVKVNEIWHNSYKHLSFNQNSNNSLDVIESADYDKIKKIIASSSLKERNQKESIKIGAKEDYSLSTLIANGKYSWNQLANSTAICVENLPLVELSSKIRIHLLSPNIEQLEALKSLWLKELKKLGYRGNLNDDSIFNEAFEKMILSKKEPLPAKASKKISASLGIEKIIENDKFTEDKSVINGSSIAFILEYDTKKILFLADSHPSVIENKLKEIYDASDFPIYFDVIKISHHGSSGNTSPAILKLIDSKYFLISTNGDSHNHPDIETLLRIVNRESHPDYKRHLVFNYSTLQAEKINEAKLKKQYNYEVIIKNEDNPFTLSV